MSRKSLLMTALSPDSATAAAADNAAFVAEGDDDDWQEAGSVFEEKEEKEDQDGLQDLEVSGVSGGGRRRTSGVVEIVDLHQTLGGGRGGKERNVSKMSEYIP